MLYKFHKFVFMNEQLKQIVNYLIDSTESGEVVWSYCNGHVGNNEHTYYLETILEDAEAKVTIPIHLDNFGNLNKMQCIIIHHKDMTAGYEVYSANHAKNIGQLEQAIFDKYQHIFIAKKVSSPLGIILDKIGKQYKRDKKIESLLESTEPEKKKFLGFF